MAICLNKITKNRQKEWPFVSAVLTDSKNSTKSGKFWKSLALTILRQARQVLKRIVFFTGFRKERTFRYHAQFYGAPESDRRQENQRSAEKETNIKEEGVESEEIKIYTWVTQSFGRILHSLQTSSEILCKTLTRYSWVCGESSRGQSERCQNRSYCRRNGCAHFSYRKSCRHGKIIGRMGNTAKAIRTLLRVIGMKNNARVNLKINEPEGSERPQHVPSSSLKTVDQAMEDLKGI